jgi:hypothetical protein
MPLLAPSKDRLIDDRARCKRATMGMGAALHGWISSALFNALFILGGIGVDAQRVYADTSEGFLTVNTGVQSALSPSSPSGLLLSQTSSELTALTPTPEGILEGRVGVGINFRWSIFGLIGGHTKESAPHLIDSGERCLAHGDSSESATSPLCSRSTYLWRGAQWWGALGVSYRPFDDLSPVFMGHLGVHHSRLSEGYEQIEAEDQRWRGRSLSDYSEWSISARALLGLEWRWSSRWGLGAGIFLERVDLMRGGACLWVSGYRYLRWW